MAWADVPAKVAAYDAEPYADNSNDTSASFKLISAFVPEGQPAILDNVPVILQADFEIELNYRYGACVNLRKSKGWNGDKLRKANS